MLEKKQKDTLAQGLKVEEAVCEWLQQKGHRIVARNVRYRMGEIDIVSYHGSVLCFVEVRSRVSTKYGLPKESVGHVKQARIIKAAQMYLMQNYKSPPVCRFDVIGAVGTDSNLQIEHIENAFVAGDQNAARRPSWRAY